MGCGGFIIFFSFFPFDFPSWQHCSFGAATKTSWEKQPLDKGQGQVPSLKYPRTCPGSTLHLVGIEVPQPGQVTPADQSKQSKGSICVKVQRKRLSNAPWSQYIPSKSWQAASILPSPLFSFAFLLGSDLQQIWWARLTGCPNASHLWKGSFR